MYSINVYGLNSAGLNWGGQGSSCPGVKVLGVVNFEAKNNNFLMYFNF